MAAVDAIGMLPSRKNWFPNPSSETSAMTVYGTATTTQDATHVWVGSWATKCVVTTTGTFSGMVLQSVSPVPLAPTAIANGAHDLAARIRVWAATGQQIKTAILRVYYTDATSQDLNLGNVNGNDDYQTLTWFLTTPDAKNISYIQLILAQLNPNTAVTFWADGAELRIDEPLDTYVDGSLGTGYRWLGTAHNSASVRDEMTPQGMTGWGGMTLVSTSVYNSDALGNDYEELTEYVSGGDMSFDIDRDIKALAKLQVSDVTKFTPYSWVKIYRTVKTEIDDAITYPIGLFRLGMPSATWLSGVGSLAGQDATVQLADTVTTDTLNLAAGKAYTTCIAELLVAAGFAGRFDIPVDSTVLPTGGLTFPTGTSYLTIINKLLSAIGYYNLYTLPDGRFASQEYINRLEVTPAHTYIIGQTADLLDEITEQPSDDNLYNYVVVTRQGTSVNYTGVAENKRASHPYSTVALGKLAGLPKVYRTKRVALNEAAGQSVVTKKAREVLELSSMLRYVTVSIMPGPNHLPHEVVELEADGTSAEHLSGRYYAESYSFGLAGSDATMKYRMRRIEATDD